MIESDSCQQAKLAGIRRYAAARGWNVESLSRQRSRAAMVPSLLARHPDSEVYFVVGADKAGMFARWNASGDFDGRFHLMVFERDDGAGSAPLSMDGTVALLRPPPGVAHVSSTAVRRAFLSGGELSGLLTPAVAQILSRLDPADCLPEIWRFDGEHAFLGNRFPSPIVMDGLNFGNADAGDVA